MENRLFTNELQYFCDNAGIRAVILNKLHIGLRDAVCITGTASIAAGTGLRQEPGRTCGAQGAVFERVYCKVRQNMLYSGRWDICPAA